MNTKISGTILYLLIAVISPGTALAAEQTEPEPVTEPVT